MRKKLAILATILAVVFIYSTAWYWQGQRFKASVTLLLNDLATELHAGDMEFIYGDLRLSGFPFSHQVYIHQPRFLGDSQSFAYDIASHQPVIISMNLLANGFTLALPRHIEVTSHAAQANQKNYQLLFYHSPSFAISLSYEHGFSRLADFWLDDEVENDAFYMEGVTLDALTLQSEALSVMAVHDGEKILSLRQFQLNYEEDQLPDERVDIALDWNISHLESEIFLNMSTSEDLPFGVLNSRGKLSLEMPDDGLIVLEEAGEHAAINVEFAEMLTSHFDITLSGDLAIQENGSISKQPLTLTLKNYEKAVEYLSAFYYHYLSGSDGTKQFWSDKARIKRALKKLASERLENETSLMLQVQPSDDSDNGLITIGGYNSAEAQHIWRTGYAKVIRNKPATPPASKQNNVGDAPEKLEKKEAQPNNVDAEAAANTSKAPTRSAAPSKAIKKQLIEEVQPEEENDTIYEYPTPGRRRR